MRREITLQDFFDDDGELFPQIGELQVYRERLQRYVEQGYNKELLCDLSALIERLENTCALLYRLVDEV